MIEKSRMPIAIASDFPSRHFNRNIFCVFRQEEIAGDLWALRLKSSAWPCLQILETRCEKVELYLKSTLVQNCEKGRRNIFRRLNKPNVFGFGAFLELFVVHFEAFRVSFVPQMCHPKNASQSQKSRDFVALRWRR